MKDLKSLNESKISGLNKSLWKIETSTEAFLALNNSTKISSDTFTANTQSTLTFIKGVLMKVESIKVLYAGSQVGLGLEYTVPPLDFSFKFTAEYNGALTQLPNSNTSYFELSDISPEIKFSENQPLLVTSLNASLLSLLSDLNLTAVNVTKMYILIEINWRQ